MGDLVFLPDPALESLYGSESSLSSGESSDWPEHEEESFQMSCSTRCRDTYPAVTRWPGCGRFFPGHELEGHCFPAGRCGLRAPNCAHECVSFPGKSLLLSASAHGNQGAPCNRHGAGLDERRDGCLNRFYFDFNPQSPSFDDPVWAFTRGNPEKCCCGNSSNRWKWWRRKKERKKPKRRKNRNKIKIAYYAHGARDGESRFRQDSESLSETYDDDYDGDEDDDNKVSRHRPERRRKRRTGRTGRSRPPPRWGTSRRANATTGLRGTKRIRQRELDRTRKRSLEIEAISSDDEYPRRQTRRGGERVRRGSHERDLIIDALRDEVRRLRNQMQDSSEAFGERLRSRHSI
ncbi:hypothetical protein jhhlp_004030 [Lomentospora prolificans]|uniref:Uncharacterized protein n=1 Tax=Lomentospora prolificans TaxID=41688 RepID=A0A2N3NAE5_9PEZI|nr:hypothetical protein jhhlp_004030 [Lomentospora prolificans]